MYLRFPAFVCLVIGVGCVEYKVMSFGMGGTPIEELLDSSTKQTDTWEASGVDLVFFGDTSDSMYSELETMGANALTFMDHLDDYDSGWQIIVVTGWDGCGVNGILSTSVPDYDELFAEALVTAPEQDAVAAGADEWGLYNVDMAIQATEAGGCNEGFLREDALLHVIMLSDEDDTSPGWDGEDDTYWKSYVESVLSAKASDHLVTFSAIIGPAPDGCEGAIAGMNYTDAVEYTDGSTLSICDEWYNELDVLVYASVQIPNFPLSKTPVEETIRVTVNDEARSSGWEYLSIANMIHFTEEIPTIGQTVSVSYQVAE